MDKIISIHTGHDASVAYWEDYKQIAIYKEERLNRIKNWGRDFPQMSFDRVKDFVAINEIDVLVLSRDFYSAKYFNQDVKSKVKGSVKRFLKGEKALISINNLMQKRAIGDEFYLFNIELFLEDFGFNKNCKVLFGDHHFAHALPSLFYNPDWNEAMIYTADGGGDGIQYSFTHFSRDKLNIIYGGNDSLRSEWLPDSMGQMYGITTEICGFRKNRHEGKITGLAAFGDPKYSKKIIEMYCIDDNARIIPKFNSYDELRVVLQNIFNVHGREDLAASAQEALEVLILESMQSLKNKYSFKNIGLAGGVFANVKLNQKISELKGIEDVFIFPPMTDEGLVVGHILDYLLQRDGLNVWLGHRRELDNMYWGDEYVINCNHVPNSLKIIAESDIAEKTADLLADNKICALFSKAMEYGPRALGARSILINPSDRGINDIVNNRLNRTEFMPFAPYVLEEMVEETFEVTRSNKSAMQFMTITTNVRSEWKDKIQATVHVDGTARPQTINRDQNALYYDILKYFYKKTGIPCLVNTSFNTHEEPIIHTVQEAFDAILNDRVDYLIFENMILEKKL
jgi:carbamoyltransferase